VKTRLPSLSRNSGYGTTGKGSRIIGIGNFQHAIGYSRIFWPEFEEHDGCLFLHGAFDRETYESWLRESHGDKRATQAAMNHQHLADLFSGADQSPTHDQLLYIGGILREMWAAKLSRDFPGARIVVEFPDERLQDLQDYEITFFRE
jgi:hypothetical protein